ncbi:MAG: alpha/beta hydrolase-fold protein [Dehalococcoidia bacterium]
MVYVPSSLDAARPAPLVLCLHGANSAGTRSIVALRDAAETHALLLVAPDSRGRTWDVLLGGYGPDVAFINRALDAVTAHFRVDPERIAAEGFSDGASYALSLAIANGDLFTHIMAFSPGFMAPPSQAGTPRIFISHGTEDRVLPIAACSRRLHPILVRAGYDVTYREFDGPHTVPPTIATEAVAWFLGQASASNSTSAAP